MIAERPKQRHTDEICCAATHIDRTILRRNNTTLVAWMSAITVLKFGGTSVSTQNRWANIATIAEDRLRQGPVLIVVSALSGMTDRLKALAEAPGDQTMVGAIIDRHRRMADELAVPVNCLDAIWAEFEVARTALIAHPEPAQQAALLACGELLSSTLGAAFLNRAGLKTTWRDARHYLCSIDAEHDTAWARSLSAQCSPELNASIARRWSHETPLSITQGFIARNILGQTVLLGRGGSDTSASYFGALLGAARVEIWTDVPGMFSANPKLVPNARLLRELDYDEAQEIATTGAKVLHPRAINPVREARVPLLIKDTERPELAGTVIGPEAATQRLSVKAVSMRTGITLVSMESIGMWQQVGFLADVFERFKRHGLSVDLIGSAETNVTVSLDPSENLLDQRALTALCEDLAQVCRVKVIAPCVAITLVGRGMRAMMHRLSDVLAEIGERRVHLISQSSNNLNLTFVIDASDAEGIVERLHCQLVKAGLIGAPGDSVFGPAWNTLLGNQPSPRNAWWQSSGEMLLELAGSAPTYVYASSQLGAAIERVKSIGADRCFYALKANAHPDILRRIAAGGIGMECVSLAELDHVCTTLPKLEPERILFTPNFAPRAEYEAALARGVNVTIDSLYPLQQWPELFAGRSLLLRFDLGRGVGHHDKVKTGGGRSKFGLLIGEAVAARAAADAAGATVVGLHAHLGSGEIDPNHWRDVYAGLASLADHFPAVRVLDIGGGLGVPYASDDDELDIDRLRSTLAHVRTLFQPFEVWIEPGRYLVAEAGVLLTRVTQVRRKGDILQVGVDTGMHHLLRPALYDAWHAISNLSRADQPAATLCDIVGPICESSDVLGSDRWIANPIEGDVLLIANAGAYGAVMSSRYNQREPAREIFSDAL